jgi:hypothetical protein
VDGGSIGYPDIGHQQSVIKRRNGFNRANHPVKTMVGAITTRIDIRIGHFSKKSIAGSIY